MFRTDIADFFASVDYRLLLDRVAGELTDPGVVALVRDWVRAPVLTDTGLRDRRAGIPEGAPVSPARWRTCTCGMSICGWTPGYGRLVRFADDLALFCADLDRAVAGAEHLLTELAELGLAPNPDKTYLSSFDAGFPDAGLGSTGTAADRSRTILEQATDNPRWTHPLSSRVPVTGRQFVVAGCGCVLTRRGGRWSRSGTASSARRRRSRWWVR